MTTLDEGPLKFLNERIAHHTNELLDWAEGRRSYTNLHHANPERYPDDLIARMDAAEVAKHAAALDGLIALSRHKGEPR